MQAIEYVDSHTGGEPTRTVIGGSPSLGSDSMVKRRQVLQTQHDWLRKALILEPRGCPWLVGALIQEPVDAQATAGVIFFNNRGYLGMCGHGLIGVVETLADLGRLAPGRHRFETPAGDVYAELHEDQSVSITNVASYRYRRGVELIASGEGSIQGDIAYGGNWFFLVSNEHVAPSELQRLWTRAARIRQALLEQNICGKDQAEIDHIELFGSPSSKLAADSRNFVLCPGEQYDRSPCGTGTSAKLACLAADKQLAPGEIWRQESIVGSVFTASYQYAEQGVIPTITGRAHVTQRATCLLSERDPFRFGIETSLNCDD